FQKAAGQLDRATVLLPLKMQQVTQDREGLVPRMARDPVDQCERQPDELLVPFSDPPRHAGSAFAHHVQRQPEIVQVERVVPGHATLRSDPRSSNCSTRCHITAPRGSMYLSGQRTILTSVASSKPDRTMREASAMEARAAAMSASSRSKGANIKIASCTGAQTSTPTSVA